MLCSNQEIFRTYLSYLLFLKKYLYIVDLAGEKKITRDNAARTIVHSMIVLFRLQNSDRGGLTSFLDPFSVFTLQLADASREIGLATI